MNLKKKITGIIGDAVTKKIPKNFTIDNAVNKVMNKLSKVTGMKEAKEFKNPNKTYLYVKGASLSIGTMAGVLKGKLPKEYYNGYRIYNNDGKLKYTSESKTGFITDKDKVVLYDMKENILGKVKENFISAGVPFFEKEVRKCAVFLGDKCVCKLKRYESFGDLEFDTLEGKMHITYNGEHKHVYKIKKGNKIIAIANETPLNFVDGYTDKYVLEYMGTEPEDEVLAVLMAIALDIVN